MATAVGLAVAIPAVAMYNFFMRQSKAILANTEALTRVLLSHLVAVEYGTAGPMRHARASESDDDPDSSDEGQ